MNLFDDVETPKGPGRIVGFPDPENVEVRLKEGGLWNGAKEKVQVPGTFTDLAVAMDVPRSPRTGRKLTGAALTKYLANQGKT